MSDGFFKRLKGDWEIPAFRSPAEDRYKAAKNQPFVSFSIRPPLWWLKFRRLVFDRWHWAFGEGTYREGTYWGMASHWGWQIFWTGDENCESPGFWKAISDFDFGWNEPVYYSGSDSKIPIFYKIASMLSPKAWRWRLRARRYKHLDKER